MESLGDRIKEARKRAGFSSQGDLGQALGGLTSATIGHWEKGRNNPKLEEIVTISQICGVDLVWLITGKESEATNSEREDKILRIYRSMSDRDRAYFWETLLDMTYSDSG